MMKKNVSILIVDDDRSLSEIMMNMLEFEGYRCNISGTGKNALLELETSEYDLVLLDLKLPDMTGLNVLEQIRKTKPHQQVIMISGEGSVTTAMEAARLGIFDFLEKPLENDRMLLTIQNALEQGRLKAEKIRLVESMKAHYQMIGESRAMQEVLWQFLYVH